MCNYHVHPSAIIDGKPRIGEGTHVWHFCHIRESAVIGNNCNIGQNVYIDTNVIIGNNCKIQNNVSIYDGVTLEDYVFCGPSMVFTNDINPRAKYPKDSDKRVKTLVREGATIGANATIICGVTIGKNAFVAAGAVVTNDVSDYSMVKGVPAKSFGWICECGEILSKELFCNKCRTQFIKDTKGIKRYGI